MPVMAALVIVGFAAGWRARVIDVLVIDQHQHSGVAGNYTLR
jgi:hypothetical protein